MLSCTHIQTAQTARRQSYVHTLLNVAMRGTEQWLFILRLDNCSCNPVKMTRMEADSLA